MLALDVALLLPPEVFRRAVVISAGLPASESQGLRLDDAHLPHVTLTQQFIRADDLAAVLETVGRTLEGHPPLTLHVTGAGRGTGAVWMAIERTMSLVSLHERLMDALEPWEQPGGGETAFHDKDARPGDVAWVERFRSASSFTTFTPHVTLGHAAVPPALEPFTFEASSVAACQLGRFCTCRRVLASWPLERL